MKPFTTFMLKIHFSAQFSIVVVVVSNVNNTHSAGRHYLLHIRNLLILSISLLGTYFFHLENKRLIKQYPNIVGKISKINSSFYVLSYRTSKIIYCFDHSGSLIEEISIESFNQYFSDSCDGSITFHGKNFIISSYSGNKVLRLKEEPEFLNQFEL